MHLIDWLIVGIYLAYVIWDGSRRSRGTKNIRGYFLADRSLPWWAVGLSVMATQMSAVTLVSNPGQAYTDGMRFVQFYFGLPLAMIILCVTAVPFFYRARVYTAYEYLETRFDSRTRALTGFFFLLSRGLSCGVIIAAPAVILSIVLGWNLELTVLAIGLPTVIYTMIGGVRAVTWTDVKQMALVLAALAVVTVLIIGRLPEGVGLGGTLLLAGAASKLQTIDFAFDLNETYTFWSGLLGGLFLMLSYFGCDQSQVQRFLTARTLDAGRVSLLMTAFVKIPLQFAILLIGILVFVFYQFQPVPLLFHPQKVEELSNGPDAARFAHLQQRHHEVRRELEASALALVREGEAEGRLQDYRRALRDSGQLHVQGLELARRTDADFNDVNYIFPSFILNSLPVGLVGLMIAAVFAAAMSSIAAELNALATTTVVDFYRRFFRPEASDRHYLFFSRVVTAIWGTLACVVAIYAVNLGSLIEVVNVFGSFFYGSILGVFVLAIAIPRATAPGAFWGLLAGMGAVALVSSVSSISFLWFNVVGTVTVVVVGLAISLVGGHHSE